MQNLNIHMIICWRNTQTDRRRIVGLIDWLVLLILILELLATLTDQKNPTLLRRTHNPLSCSSSKAQTDTNSPFTCSRSRRQRSTAARPYATRLWRPGQRLEFLCSAVVLVQGDQFIVKIQELFVRPSRSLRCLRHLAFCDASPLREKQGFNFVLRLNYIFAQ